MLRSLSTAVKTRYDPFPLASSLMGSSAGDDTEQQMAQRFVLKTGKQVFVSANLPDDNEMMNYIERVILNRLREEHYAT
jgi:hypothetical protein